MGIPSYFKQIVSRYANVIMNNKGHQPIDRLFIDFNCILHKCAHDISHKHLNISAKVLEDMVMKESIKYVQYLRTIISPQSIFYVAIDGLCPRAKMTQQRKRRYISSWRTKQVCHLGDYKQSINLNWNSNIITPGTDFMQTFNDLIKAEFKNDSKVIISDSNEMGEGEHKIYKLIKDNTSTNVYNDIVYGLDADLILLSLINTNGNQTIKLMRENTEFKAVNKNKYSQEFLYLDIASLKQSLINHYLPPYEHDDFIRDYVFLCTFVGNDFLPPLSFIKVRNNAIDMIIEIYKNERQINHDNKSDKQDCLISKNGVIHEVMLHNILKTLSESENQFMQEAHQSYLNRKVPQTHHKSYQRIFYELDNYPGYHLVSTNIIDTQNKTWRNQYYHNLFHRDLISDICQNYAEGLQWIVDYYIKQDCLLDWYYKYSYSPLIMEFAKYIECDLWMIRKQNLRSLIDNNKHITSNHDFIRMTKENFMQLFMVLPPCSAYLIPDQVCAKIMTQIEKGCVHLYPINFMITTFLKTFLWECSAILPNIDIVYLNRKLMEMKKL
jgi:5'-3' exonuclease